MTQPICNKCDYVAGCQSRARLCPNLAEPEQTPPVTAYLTRHDTGDMLFFDKAEAQRYCDDSPPEPLVLLSIAQPEQANISEFTIADLAMEHLGSYAEKDYDFAVAVISASKVAQPEQPAVADFYQFQTKDGAWHFFSDEDHYENTVADGRWPVRSLYVTPPVAQPKQPAAYMDADGNLFSAGSHEKFGYGSIPLYTPPNIAQPVPITHDDWYAKCNMLEALQDKVFALNAMREAQDEILVNLRKAYVQSIAQPEQQTLPSCYSDDAVAFIEKHLALRNYPANSHNAARAGWDAACDLLANIAQPEQPTPVRQPLTDDEITQATCKQRDELLDFIYEYGTAAEGVSRRVVAIARAIEAAHGITKDKP